MRLRALIFEDEAAIRQLLWFVCDRRGYEVFTFPDPGMCPLHVIDRCPCPAGTSCADIIISDINMLEVNGLDFVEALATKGCALPHFALVSGAWTDEDRARASRLGCTLFVKPFSFVELTTWLEHVERRVAPTRRLLDWDAQGWRGVPPGEEHGE